MLYIQVSGNHRAVATCSDNSCPCGYPGATIRRGTGYMYISKQVVDFRQDCLTEAQVQRKVEQVSAQMGKIIFMPGTFSPTLMCEQGARKRGLDLETAAADAQYWWQTGKVPLRPTPLTGTKPQLPTPQSRISDVASLYRTIAEKTIEVEADSLAEARELAQAQIPQGFKCGSEKVVSDGQPKMVTAAAATVEEALAKAHNEIPAKATIRDETVVSTSDQKIILIDAFEEAIARSTARYHAREHFGAEGMVKEIKFVKKGRKGFLGIGAKPDNYEAEIVRKAVVKVTYDVKAKIRITIGKEVYALGLAEPRHAARQLIDAAAQVADQIFEVLPEGVKTDRRDAKQLADMIEKALALSPDDPDLLMAQANALLFTTQAPPDETMIERALSIHPEHFEAEQRKKFGFEQGNLFRYPPWSTNANTLHPLLRQQLQQGHSLQLVRDGLQQGVVVIRPVQRQELSYGFSNQTPCKWVPVWSETPHGVVIAHYVIIEDKPHDPWRGESFLFVGDKPDETPQTGYWLLKRLSHLSSCFIVLTDGQTVLYNKRYIFPDALRSKLSDLAKRLDEPASVLAKDSTNFRTACQWHENHFDMTQIH